MTTLTALPPKCAHTETTLWFPVDAHGNPMLIELPTGMVSSLTLCLECGRTFASCSDSDKKRRTAATSRLLEGKVKA